MSSREIRIHPKSFRAHLVRRERYQARQACRTQERRRRG